MGRARGARRPAAVQTERAGSQHEDTGPVPAPFALQPVQLLPQLLPLAGLFGKALFTWTSLSLRGGRGRGRGGGVGISASRGFEVLSRSPPASVRSPHAQALPPGKSVPRLCAVPGRPGSRPSPPQSEGRLSQPEAARAPAPALGEGKSFRREGDPQRAGRQGADLSHLPGASAPFKGGGGGGSCVFRKATRPECTGARGRHLPRHTSTWGGGKASVWSLLACDPVTWQGHSRANSFSRVHVGCPCHRGLALFCLKKTSVLLGT